MFEDCPKSQLLLIIELEIYAESGLAETYQKIKVPVQVDPCFQVGTILNSALLISKPILTTG